MNGPPRLDLRRRTSHPALWLIAPLVFDRIHRADARSAVLVLLALLPCAVVSGILVLESPFYGLPAAMYLATGVFVGVRRATN